jgi:hypothetical protein
VGNTVGTRGTTRSIQGTAKIREWRLMVADLSDGEAGIYSKDASIPGRGDGSVISDVASKEVFFWIYLMVY